MNSLYETVHSTNTLLGIQNQLNRDVGLINVNLDQSLNNYYDILPTTEPTTLPTMQYFGIGTNGWNNNTPRIPSATNLNLFNQVPITIALKSVVIAQPNDYADYRMWKVMFIDDKDYVLFYLKKIDFLSSVVKLSEVNNTTGNTSSYDHDSIDFTPAVTTSISSTKHIAASLEGRCEISGEEITNANAVLAKSGDMGLIGTISELGFYTGADVQHTLDGVTYTESVGTQLAMHRCLSPFGVSSASIKYNIPVNFINGSRAVLST